MYLISLKSIFFVLDCRYYKSLIKHVYQLPPPPALLIIVFVSRLLCAVRWTQIFFVYLSTKYSLLLTGLKLCWDLNLNFYSLPMNFNSPNPSFSLLSFVPGSGSHKIFVFNQLLFRLLLVTFFTYLVKCVLITIWLYTYSECPSAESEGVMFYSWGGLKIFPFFFFYARDKTVTLLSFPFSFTNLSFLFKKQYCAKI